MGYIKWQSLSKLQASMHSSSSLNQNSFTLPYLINTCGLSLKAAISASNYLNFETTEKPDSVIAFLKSHGFSDPQIKTLIMNRPRVLASDINTTLLPKLEFFESKGISSPDVAKILANHPTIFSRSLENHIVPSFNFLTRLLESDEASTKAITCFPRIMTYDIHKFMLPNIVILRNYGVPESNIVKALHSMSTMFLRSPTTFKETVEKVKGMDFDPMKLSFLLAVATLNFMTRSVWDRKLSVYKVWGLSEEEIIKAFRKNQSFMNVSEKKTVKIMDFLVKEMGWQSKDVARRPRVSTLSLEKRTRCLFVRDLVSKGLLNNKEFNLLTVLESSENIFIDKFVNRYKEDAPQLLKLYKQKLEINH